MYRTKLFLTSMSLLFLPGCPNTDGDVGTPCDVRVDAGPAQGAFYAAAPECATHLCLKPVGQSTAGASATVDTAAFCTAKCSTDSDCDGVLRDSTNLSDKTCTSGYTCGIAFVKGALCCQKLCICKDFTGGDSIATPTACQTTEPASCN